MVETWTLNYRNWWLNKNENFFTSESRINAIVAWIIWSVLLLIEYAFLIYVTILLILAVALIKDSGFKYFMMYLGQELFLICRALFGRTFCFIIGRTYVGPLGGGRTQDDEFYRAQKYELDRIKRDAFLSKEKKSFSSFMNIIKVHDCPVCLEEF